MSGYYAQQNSGKRNVSIDLNAPHARELVLRLCDEADIIVENFRAGTLKGFGLDYDTLSRRNPKLVYVSITGYGQRGSWASRMAYAPTVQAETGFTHNTLRHFDSAGDGRRWTDPLSHADVYAGLQATIAVLAAVRKREVTGRGQYIDVAMAAVMLSINERAHLDLAGIDTGAERASSVPPTARISLAPAAKSSWRRKASWAAIRFRTICAPCAVWTLHRIRASLPPSAACRITAHCML